MNRVITKLTDIIALTRPLLLVPIWAPYILGHNSRPQGMVSTEFLIGFVAVTLLGIGIYVFNQIHDIDSDRLNDKGLALARGFIKVGTGQIIVILSFVTAIVIGFLVNILTGLLLTLGVIFGIFYSVPKLAAKNRPLLSLFLNALGHGALIFILGATITKPLNLATFVNVLPYFFAYGGVFLFTTIPDIEGDRAMEKNTFAVKYGALRTSYVGLTLILLAGGSALLVKSTPIVITTLITLPLYLGVTFMNKHYVAVNKVAVLTLALIAAVYCPFFFILLIFTIVFVKLYNKFRLKVDYP